MRGVEPGEPSVAEGLAIAAPVRESGGTCLAVDEEPIQAACLQIAHRGSYVEPTSATAVAALPAVFALAAPGETMVVPLTGSGLKGSPVLK